MVKETEFYDRLEIKVTATPDEVKKAYKRMAMRYHPDKNPDNPDAAERFKEIGEAYEVLSDANKRKMYDAYGRDGLKERGFHSSSAADIFQAFFGGGSPFASFFGGGGGEDSDDFDENDDGQPRVQRYALPVTLEELYTGATKEVPLPRKVVCPGCKGSGSKSGKEPVRCTACGGRGVAYVQQQRGMFVQRFQTRCPNCGGRGVYRDPGDACVYCEGRRVIGDKATVKVCVEAGMQDGQRVTVRGQGDQHPSSGCSNDLVFVLKLQRHQMFLRVENDILLKRDIPLVQALTGVTLRFRHLDGKCVVARTQPGRVVRPKDVLVLRELGFPVRGRYGCRGDLFVRFRVIFPVYKEIAENVDTIKAILSSPGNDANKNEKGKKKKVVGKGKKEGKKKDYDDVDDDDDDDDDMGVKKEEEEEEKDDERVAVLTEPTRNPGENVYGNAYDEDNEDDEDDMRRGGGGATRVQCSQQ